jgi:hypothetical protein
MVRPGNPDQDVASVLAHQAPRLTDRSVNVRSGQPLTRLDRLRVRKLMQRSNHVNPLDHRPTRDKTEKRKRVERLFAPRSGNRWHRNPTLTERH